MFRRRRVAWTVVALALGACRGDDSATTGPSVVHEAPAPPRDARLRDDCGGWTPTPDLLDDVAGVLAEASKPDTLAAVQAVAPEIAARRVDVLRAGLRLRDVAAAKTCAARLTWKQIDRWECARCVDLLIDDVLKPDGEASFEEVRSYIGSVELTRYLRSLPPLPWICEPSTALGQMHRIERAEHIPVLLEVTRRPEETVADAAWSEISLLGRWNDEYREDVARREAELPGRIPPVPDAGAGPGLSPALAAYLRWAYVEPGPEVVNDNSFRVPNETIRWCWESTPGPRDAGLLTALAQKGSVDWTGVAGVAYALLGKLHDPATEAFLRDKSIETDEHMPDQLAAWALARRGDAAMIERLIEDARGPEDFALALLMEAAPERARRLIDEALFGADDEAADNVLDAFEDAMSPGAFFEPCGYDWRRTSLDGLEAAAIASNVSARRLARIGIAVPGCRTRALARSACDRLSPGDLDSDALGGRWDDVAAFLETGAPDELRAALRRLQIPGGDDLAEAVRWLVLLGDPEAAAWVVEAKDEMSWTRWMDLARTRAPKVRERLEADIRAWLASGDAKSPPSDEVIALAVWHGLPEDAKDAFETLPREVVELVLAGRPVDAVAQVLAAAPDAWHGNVGAVNDPRVRAYLVRLRGRRDLEKYWYATGQLAVMGDAAARAEFWGAMQDGRYRIVNEAELFDRTLGWNIAETMPFWIDELRSQCCRIVTGGGDIVDETIDIDCFQTPWRTAHRRAKELWDAAGGHFVKSRIAGHWVPEPR